MPAETRDQQLCLIDARDLEHLFAGLWRSKHIGEHAVALQNVFRGEQHKQFVDTTTSTLASFFRDTVSEERVFVVFYCHWGKHRTGCGLCFVRTNKSVGNLGG